MSIDNKYKIGEDLYHCGKHEAEDWERFKKLPNPPLNVSSYWRVAHLNLNVDNEAVCERLREAHGDDIAYAPERAFVTDDVDIFNEIYRHLLIDFVCDFKSGLFFMDLYARHETLMGHIYESSSKKVFKSYDDAAEQYVIEGYGCFKSSQSSTIWLGEDVAIPSYLRPWKQNIKRM